MKVGIFGDRRCTSWQKVSHGTQARPIFVTRSLYDIAIDSPRLWKWLNTHWYQVCIVMAATLIALFCLHLDEVRYPRNSPWFCIWSSRRQSQALAYSSLSKTQFTGLALLVQCMERVSRAFFFKVWLNFGKVACKGTIENLKKCIGLDSSDSKRNIKHTLL